MKKMTTLLFHKSKNMKNMKINNCILQLLVTVSIFLYRSEHIKANHTDTLISTTTAATVVKYCGLRTRYTAQVTTNTPLNQHDLIKIATTALIHSDTISICEIFDIEGKLPEILNGKMQTSVTSFNFNASFDNLRKDLETQAPKSSENYKIKIMITKDQAPILFLRCCL